MLPAIRAALGGWQGAERLLSDIFAPQIRPFCLRSRPKGAQALPHIRRVKARDFHSSAHAPRPRDVVLLPTTTPRGAPCGPGSVRSRGRFPGGAAISRRRPGGSL